MKKRALTLLEIMIVIFLITLITGAIGYNMRGTLDKGRAFRSEQAQEQLRDLLLICLADGVAPEDLMKDPAKVLKTQGLAKDPDSLIFDGWKERFVITLSGDKKDVKVFSKALIKYQNKHKQDGPQEVEAEEE